MIADRTKVLCTILAAAMSVSSPAAQPEAHPIPVEVEQGRTTSVMLRSNPSTGFSWGLAEPLPEGSPVEISIRLSTAEPASSPRCGTPGHTIVEFRGLRPGTERVCLLYRRPWEKGKKPARELSFEVRVTK